MRAVTEFVSTYLSSNKSIQIIKMKKLLLLFVLVLTVCSTVKAQEESLTMLSPVGTIGTLDGREAMVVDLGGSIGKVAIATMNVGATSIDDAGKQFNMAEANNPATNGLTDGWYVPSADELTALCAKLEANDSQPGLKWKVSDASTLYLPGYEVVYLGYCGMYVSSSSDCSTLVFTYNDNLELTKNIVAPMANPENIGWSVIRPFHKLPTAYSYVYPVYNDPDDVTKGVKDWETETVSAIEVTSSTEPVTLGEAGKTTWYVITGTDVTLSKGAICAGNVNLILADGAKLTATTEEYGLAGIQVFGEGNSLAIYGQTAQSGQLIASGGDYGAGIGGRNGCYGSHITINGGTVTATGGYRAAGIGGGFHSSGSNITINGGTVTANGGENAAGIGSGCGAGGSAYNITFNGGTVKATGGEGAVAIGTGQDADHSQFIFASHLSIVKAGNSENPTTEIASEHTSTTDIASDLADKKYVTIELRKIVVVYGDNITVSPTFTSGAEITARTQITFTAADRSADGYDFSGFFEDSTFNTPITTGVNGLTYTTPVNAPIFVYAKYDCHQSNSASYIYPVYNDPEDITKGVEKWETETSDAFVINPSATSVTLGEAGKNTWYVVTGTDVQLTSGAICYGNVNLILADGAKLTATGEYGLAGIQVSGEGNSLTIYGQKNQSGQLIAQGGSQAAGIGGGASGSGSNITINGVTVTANGRDGAAGIGGGTSGAGSNIIINDCKVTANSYDGAGIGGGTSGAGSNIIINDCKVTANSYDGAGIGGGSDGAGSNITINGGEVIANNSNNGAGIGGGFCGSGLNITINGGKVTSNSEGRGAGIGGGLRGYGSDITINGGTVTAIGGRFGGDGIGSGLTGRASVNIFVAKTHFVKAGDTEETIFIVYNPSEDFTSRLVGKRFATIEPISAPEEPKEVTYIDENGEEQKVEAEVVLTRPVPVTLGEPGKTTWYAVTYADEQLVSPVCQGDVRLILADGAKLTATGIDDALNCTPGIQVSGDGNSLTIYCQNAQSGQFVTYGGKHGAGIGGGNRGDGSSITINGGTVNAHGGDAGAGIGGGRYGSCSNITINGGTVNAYGGDSGAGIGGGFDGSCSNITISGGEVIATGGNSGAGIGGGNGSSGSYITINGGTVTANGTGVYAAGIGGGYGGDGSNITINGGMVTANGGRYCAGIGCGFNSSDASNIFVATNLILKADGNNPPTTVIENNGDDLAESLAGQQYATVSDDICNITANQDPSNKANYYSTFYSNKKAYSVPEGVMAYTGVVDGDMLKLTAIESGIIPAGEAVILRLITEDDTDASLQIVLTATTTTATKSDDNMLQGSDVPLTLPTNSYALSLGQHGVGFYDFSGYTLPAHKAYLTLSAASAGLRFSFGDATDIDVPVTDTPANAYNLQGQRVDENYRGIVIINGKKSYNN